MKLISKELPEVLKTVKLCEGIEFVIKDEFEYIFVDSYGFVWATSEIPLVCRSGWATYNDVMPEYLGKVDLEGMDWRETLVRV